jgi:acyl-[acyl-carrier-protein]-phospholipid O-acyltransferase/long-chain-fatty-acid--[acyl-carrier-protein] ligase
VISWFYRIKVLREEPLPEGGFLLLPNHLTWVDAILLQMSCPRPVRFLVDEGIYRRRHLNPLLRLFGALPVSSQRPTGALRASIEALRRGECVCIFPEGELSRSGTLLRLRPGFELIARHSGSPVVPVWLDQLWGSIFSFSEGRFFWKWPRQLPYPVTVAYGRAISASEASMALVRERLWELGERCYRERPELRLHLGREAIAGLRKGRFDTALIDGMDGSRLTRGMLLAAGLALSGRVRQGCRQKRVGIVLPPGKGAVLANLAVVLAGKVPVNLNFTASRDSLLAAFRIAELEEVVTAGAFETRLGEFPWPKQVWRLEEWIGGIRGRVVLWRVLVELLPGWMLGALSRLPREGAEEEATVLFTSGSSGDPKGVVLSHRNLLGNVAQFSTMLGFGRGASVLSCLPMFHSFGSTVTLWYPILKGLRMVCYPSPLDAPKNADLIAEHRVDLLCSTPTFLRAYLRKVDPQKLESLQLVITGAERLPPELADAFEARFGKMVLQGYGLTETAPVVSVNLPDPAKHRPEDAIQPSNRRGSVGKMAPGIAAQIRDPDSGQKLSLHDTGMLWLRGANIFEGYLQDPERTREMISEGWLRTGDLGRFDEDGFLYIEGRISRFSKIAGEMVPHERVEQYLYEALGLSAEEKAIAVTGVPDEQKGEALVVLAACEADWGSVRVRLLELGVPSLWIPRHHVRAEKIPHLATGKLDLRKIREMALDALPGMPRS